MEKESKENIKDMLSKKNLGIYKMDEYIQKNKELINSANPKNIFELVYVNKKLSDNILIIADRWLEKCVIRAIVKFSSALLMLYIVTGMFFVSGLYKDSSKLMPFLIIGTAIMLTLMAVSKFKTLIVNFMEHYFYERKFGKKFIKKYINNN